MKKPGLFFLILSLLPLILPAQIKSAETIYEQINDAIVRIYTYHDDNSMHGQGSGIILQNQGIIVTNHHLLGDASVIYAEHNGVFIKLDSILAMDSQKDILILTFDKAETMARFKSIPKIKIGNSDNLKVGQRIYTIGSPYGFENTMTEGIISGLRSSNDSTRKFIQISAPISSGSSGGAVLNAKGELIGISTMVVSGETAQNLNFALPINDVLQVATDPGKASVTSGNAAVNDYYQKGYKSYMTRNYSAAIFNFQQALRNSNDPEQQGSFYYFIGLSYQRTNQYDSATFFFEKSLNKVISAETYMSLGEIAADLGDYQKAGLYFAKAIETNPTSWEAHNNLGIMYYKQKDYANALASFDKSIKSHSKNPNAFYMLGKIVDVNMKGELAVSFYKKAIQYNPQFADAYLALSGALLNLGDMENAIINQQKAYQLNPQLRKKKL